MLADTVHERALTLRILRASITALASVIGRNTEIVLHDLTQPSRSVIAIANGHVTNRKVGSPVLAGPGEDKGFAAVGLAIEPERGEEPVVITDYATVVEGRSLRSATVVFRDSDGIPFASLCINADLSGLRIAQAVLDQFQPSAKPVSEVTTEPGDMEVLMTDIIQDALTKAGSVKMNKKAKVEAVRVMQERGLFIVKGGVEKAASALGVTRFTVYNYLDQLKIESSVD